MPQDPRPIGHYENFPVASVLCPPALRPAVAAIYHFARTADDLADEGDFTPQQRLADLAAYRADLRAVLDGASPSPRWAPVFLPLAIQTKAFALPPSLLHDLLSAFEQDVRYTAAQHHYSSHAELLDYCRLSANPVGRLLLHLYGVSDDASLTQSDQICSALQLVNFWQDLSVDIPRARHYLPQTACERHGVTRAELAATAAGQATSARCAALVAEQLQVARTTMLAGASLAMRVPGRAGWELRLVVQGGLRILDRLEAPQADPLHLRPRLRAWDLPRLLWRAWRMG